MTNELKSKLESVTASVRFLSYLVTIVTLPMILWMAKKAVETIESNKDRITVVERDHNSFREYTYREFDRVYKVTDDHEARIRSGGL